MKIYSGIINRFYGWELALFHKLRDISDGIIFFKYIINWDRYETDHSPRFTIHIIALNYTIIEFNIYYLHHRI
jgi:hypothetical protein